MIPKSVKNDGFKISKSVPFSPQNDFLNIVQRDKK